MVNLISHSPVVLPTADVVDPWKANGFTCAVVEGSAVNAALGVSVLVFCSAGTVDVLVAPNANVGTVEFVAVWASG